MPQVFRFCKHFNFQEKKQKSNSVTQLQYMFFPCARGKLKLKLPVEELRRYRPHKLMNIASPYKKFYIFHFFNFREKLKLTLCCTAPIFVLSMCRGKIKSVEELRRYRPYKLMNIASPYKKFYIFSKNSHFLNFQEKSK